MIYELPCGEFENVRNLFEDHKQYVPVIAVIEGNFPGRVFVDNTEAPSNAMVWAVSRWSYVEGKESNKDFFDFLPELFDKIIIPDSKKISMDWFEFYLSNSKIMTNNLENSLKDFKLFNHMESVYVWDKEKYKLFREKYIIPEKIQIEKVDCPIIPKSTCNVSFIMEKFSTMTSFGFDLFIENNKIARCCPNGFTTGNEFMIDVNTYGKEDRGKGYATAAGVALLDYCLENNLKPL